MQLQKLTFLFAFIFLTSFLHGQWLGSSLTGPTYRTGTVGIGLTTNTAASRLSVNGNGDSRWAGYFHTTSTINGNRAILGEADQPSGFDHHIRAVSGIIESGTGYAYGLQGIAATDNPSNAGRAYGVFGQASNATPGANYGVYARLYGSNSGTALLATDDVNFFDPTGGQYLLGNKSWAGYFIGDLHVSNKVGIQSTDPQSSLSVGGDGNAQWTGYFHTTSTTSGDRAIYGEADQPSGFADHIRAVSGGIESGTGYAYGVQGTSGTDNPSNAGRAYGVYGQAANATPGANYGVYGRLYGSNGGAAVFGADDVNFEDPQGVLLGNQTWAGYFMGNVEVTNALGIGCTTMNPNPTGASGSVNYRLFVDGGIAGRELLIQNGGNWCDYVFEEDYDLKSLEEVEQHIKEKGHLHNTPSATEMEEAGGFEVGNITLNQQEKIEEIFLHLIDLKKEVKALKAENEKLKAQIEGQQ